MNDLPAIKTDLNDLLHGSARQRAAYRVLQQLRIFEVLRDYDPLLVGTIPLGIDVAGSDLDIICEAYDLDAFERAVRTAFGKMVGFTLRRKRINDLPVLVAKFIHDGFPVEIFGQPRPVCEQHACRHLIVEARLLALGGEDARRAIRRLKREGLKTEPAFARYFGITGDPFARLLELAELDDAALIHAITMRSKETATMTMMNPERFIRAMQQTPVLLDALLCGVTQERAAAAVDGPDGWNVIEIVCHLRDFEEIFFERARRIVAEDHPELPYYDHEVLAVERSYASQDLSAAFEAYRETRRQFVAWLQVRQPDEWARMGVHPEAGDYTLLEQAMQVSLHDVNHLEQIARVLGLPCDDTAALFGLGRREGAR